MSFNFFFLPTFMLFTYLLYTLIIHMFFFSDLDDSKKTRSPSAVARGSSRLSCSKFLMLMGGGA